MTTYGWSHRSYLHDCSVPNIPITSKKTNSNVALLTLGLLMVHCFNRATECTRVHTRYYYYSYVCTDLNRHHCFLAVKLAFFSGLSIVRADKWQFYCSKKNDVYSQNITFIVMGNNRLVQ